MTRRGWCPGIYEPMPSGDGLLVRVKPFGGRLPAASLRALANAAEAHGNGVIELTSRGNLQIRGLTAASAADFAAAMADANLADPDPARERRRNVIVMPPYDDALAAEVEDILAGMPGLAAKFCVALGQAQADIAVDAGSMIAGGFTVPYSPDALRRVAEDAAGCRLPPVAVTATPPPGLFHLRYGQTDAATLRQMADATDDARTTPYRAFYAPGLASGGADPLRIAACPGAPACASATTRTRADADFLASLGIDNLHVSGCSKGCAYPHATRTLIARNGRYDLVRHGRASDPPDFAGVTIAEAAALLA